MRLITRIDISNIKKKCPECKQTRQLSEFIRANGKERISCNHCAEKKRKYTELHHDRDDRKIENRFSYCRTRAKKREIDWSLSLEEFIQIVSKPCHYCNNKLGKKIVKRGFGMDRLDNSKGYSIENAVSCCWECNTIKSEILTEDEAKRVIRFILEMRQKGSGTL